MARNSSLAALLQLTASMRMPPSRLPCSSSRLQAAHMPTLLLGTSAAALDSPAVAAAAAVVSAQPHGPVEFWQLFRLEATGNQGSKNVGVCRAGWCAVA